MYVCVCGVGGESIGCCSPRPSLHFEPPSPALKKNHVGILKWGVSASASGGTGHPWKWMMYERIQVGLIPKYARRCHFVELRAKKKKVIHTCILYNTIYSGFLGYCCCLYGIRLSHGSPCLFIKQFFDCLFSRSFVRSTANFLFFHLVFVWSILFNT